MAERRLGEDTESVDGVEAVDDATHVESPAARRSAQLQTPGTQDLPGGRGSVTGSGSSPQRTLGATTSASPLDAMWMEEIARTRVFVRIATALATSTLIALPLLGGNDTLRWASFCGIASLELAFLWLYWVLRDPNRFTDTKMTIIAFYTAVIVYIGVFYWGVFSAAPALIVLGIYFYSRAQNIRGTLLIYLTCAVAQGVLSGLIIMEVIDDPGLFPVNAQRTTFELVVTQGLVQGIYLATYAVGRSSRKSTLDAMDKIQSAMRQVSNREALLQEARQDLDAALQVGGAGRYTDHRMGEFELGPVIGRGAMGEVYEASHRESSVAAAVKLLHEHVLDNPDHVARFLREAQAAGQLQSQHVVKVLQASAPGEPVPFLAMERLRGHDLAYHLRKRRRLSLAQLAELAEQVAEALDEAAGKQIVHRDLKPQNLFLAERAGDKPIWKVLDFGVSKLAGTSGTLTAGHVVGTPVYMAPEQARSGEVDYRADVYALAAIAYRCATGRPPFAGRDIPSILYNVVYTQPPRPSELAALPQQLDWVLAIGLAKRRDDRFQSAGELADALAAAARAEIDDWLHRRAEALLAEHPWGSRK